MPAPKPNPQVPVTIPAGVDPPRPASNRDQRAFRAWLAARDKARQAYVNKVKGRTATPAATAAPTTKAGT